MMFWTRLLYCGFLIVQTTASFFILPSLAFMWIPVALVLALLWIVRDGFALGDFSWKTKGKQSK